MSENIFTAPRQSQLHRELMGVLSLSSFDAHNSASRKQMFSSHIGQTLVIKGATRRRIQTGMEQEYGKYTFNVKAPANLTVLKVINRYPKTLGAGSIKSNPEILVIYEIDETRQIGCMSLLDYYSNHSYFGFKYAKSRKAHELRAGLPIPEGFILQDSPAVTADGDYMYGAECNVAFMSHPAVSEDGILISRDVLDRFSFKTYETRVIEWGSNFYPLNLYGDANNYRPIPDIGDPVREDGLLAALRSLEDGFSPAEMSINSTQNVNPIFDHMVYAGGPGGKVIDVRVMHDPESAVPTTPVGMEGHTRKYDTQRHNFYQEIVSEYARLKKDRGEALKLTEEFHRLVVESISVVGMAKGKGKKEDSTAGERVIKLYRNAPLDDWRVEIVIEYDVTPTIGFKLTDCHGGKGVICHIAEPHEMPIDADGNRADIVMDPNATVSRMNLGRLYEHFINASARDLTKEIRRTLGFPDNPAPDMKFNISGHPGIEQAWTRLLRFYEIVSPRMHQLYSTGSFVTTNVKPGKKPKSVEFNEGPEAHLLSIIKDGIYVYYPPDNEVLARNVVKQLEVEFPSCYGPVQYVGNSGILRKTKHPVRIGSLYIIILEKTGDDWTAVSSGKLQNFGVLAPITNRDKYSQPTRNQAIRAFGETEIRIVAAYMGPQTTAEILDRNNSIVTHAQMLESILTAEKPSNIECAVDRTINPLGGARPLQLVKHIGACGGWEFVYAPHIPTPPLVEETETV